MLKNKGASVKLTFFFIMLIIFSIAIYFTFFYTYKCKDMACFQTKEAKCSKANFLHDKEDITWFYQIKGKENRVCKINVEILQIKKSTLDKKSLKGKSMDCYLPLGSTNLPGEEIENCHGILKEEFQTLIIQKLHSYIVENLGEIGEELQKVVI